MKKIVIILLIIIFIALLALAKNYLYNTDSIIDNNEPQNSQLSGEEININQDNIDKDIEKIAEKIEFQEAEENDELTSGNPESGSIKAEIDDLQDIEKIEDSGELVIDTSYENQEKSIQERLAEINSKSISKAEIIFLDEQSFNEKVLNSNEKIIVDFYADWCEPCQYLAPIYEQVANENLDIPFYKLNVDEVGTIAEKYSVYNIPTIILFKDGKEYNRIVGVPVKEDLVSFVNQ